MCILDSLTYRNEIRIYKSYITTNGTEIFRMYEVENSKWEVEFYNYYAAIESQGVKEYFDKEKITSVNDLNYLWIGILNTHVLYMPNQDEIKYKLEEPTEVIVEDGKYYYKTSSSYISDGFGYTVLVKKGKEQNHITYANPEAWLNRFPGVDELESIKALLDIIRNDFNIWQE